MGTVLARPRAAKRRETAVYTLHCQHCGQPLFQTEDLAAALDVRDFHGVETLHDAEIWVRVAGRTFRLAGTFSQTGRALSFS